MADLSIRLWALKGAEQRLVEIAAEAAAIYKAFPELREQGGKSPAGGNGAAPTRKRRRFTMSAEARARIAEAQRKRWAAVRASKANGGEQADTTQKPVSRRGSRKKR